MKWAVIAAYFRQEHIEKHIWLSRFVSPEKYDFQLMMRSKPITNWHDRDVKFTTLPQWLIHWKHAAAALNSEAKGVITLFPQLPTVIGLQKLLTGSRKPVVAWTFNIGNYKVGPLRRRLSQLSLSRIDRFIVHSRQEIDIYSDWLGLPKERFEFVPFPCAGIEGDYEENTDAPFIASLGSAHRDFPCFFEAVKDLDIPTTVASGKSALAGIDIPSNVQTPFGISRADCHQIAQEGRLNVIALQSKADVTAAGHVTVIEAMHMGRPIIVSDCYRMGDYIKHGETGWLVKPGCVDSLKEAITLLWNDDELRNRLGRNAKAYAEKHFTEAAAAKELERILDDVTDQDKEVLINAVAS
ncbi:glycosyltransferase family 4 protein [Leptothoe kymatousa]|uniref:Glycosyltransferase family 4 protein n=1 Tax=Leptothoe kymatousa TAU-MAC 1615 TaxID=2364775 RepID=A0ABS5XZT8_9CYAN|nr:glycosyltransferase family 4 protein [Leptothoe kymatousa]MBT9311109.1 glycosyltransferase family 4 protein [Leptothoe kymatousa TAU-MAC 1615]